MFPYSVSQRGKWIVFIFRLCSRAQSSVSMTACINPQAIIICFAHGFRDLCVGNVAGLANWQDVGCHVVGLDIQFAIWE